MGEPAGIGPEVALAAFDAWAARSAVIPSSWWAMPMIFAAHAQALIRHHRRGPRRVPGKPDAANAAAVIEAIEIAVKACLAGEAAAMVTAPIHKAVLAARASPFPAIPNSWPHLTGARRAVMMLASDKLRVVPLTIHVPLARVPGRDHQAGDRSRPARSSWRRCARDFGIANPRLAVAGLNPHAGEDGVLGGEEEADHRARHRGAEGARLCRDAARCPPTRCSTTKRARRYDAALMHVSRPGA